MLFSILFGVALAGLQGATAKPEPSPVFTTFQTTFVVLASASHQDIQTRPKDKDGHRIPSHKADLCTGIDHRHCRTPIGGMPLASPRPDPGLEATALLPRPYPPPPPPVWGAQGTPLSLSLTFDNLATATRIPPKYTNTKP
ncbi:hypothetical protein B0T16DRAFT_388010 [Cercophora newfieldiana]|uniref:Uncharacterized protein n=1 Tax=Cercophora newfieldiana TaxID=92897 RepID=A0AA40CW34_9PEZI|nr:hypothetical protein B0T16DRAFT_388010 [Cercophora newfieldiana]